MFSGLPLSYRKMPLTFQPDSSNFVNGDVHRPPGISHVKPVRNTCGVSSALKPHSSGSAGFCTVPLIPSAPCALSAPLLFSFE